MSWLRLVPANRSASARPKRGCGRWSPRSPPRPNSKACSPNSPAASPSFLRSAGCGSFRRTGPRQRARSVGAGDGARAHHRARTRRRARRTLPPRAHPSSDLLVAARSGEPVRVSAPEAWVREMEPALTTAPELEGVLAELSRREPIFHRPDFGISRADFERMTGEDYWETGASGRRYSRPFVLDGLEERFSVPHEDVWETMDFQCRKLSEDIYLLTYTLLQDHARLTRRATIWRRTPEGWKIVYHQ